jgi:hypothetical protein
MKPLNSLVFFATLTLLTAFHVEIGAGDDKKTIEFTKDNPESLIGATSDSFTIYGVRLGMSQEEAWQVLQTRDGLIAEQDPQNPFIKVFKKGPGGAKSQDVLFTLNWEAGSQSVVITLTDACAEVLTPNVKRLFKEADAERPTAFVEKFLGPASSRKVDKKYQKSGMILQIASYDSIGLIVQRIKAGSGNRVSLKLKEALPPTSAATEVRKWTDNTGSFQIRGTLVGVADGKVTLRKEDDTVVVVPLSRLSAEDRDFLKQRE